MDPEKLIEKQIEEISKHKWIESEKAGYDRGEEAVKEWIKKYGKIDDEESGEKPSDDS